MVTSRLVISSLIIFANLPSFASVQGEVHPFSSPNGLTEECVVTAKFPGGIYSKKDTKKEEEYCAIDIYNSDIALCPKVWSTSPGTMVYQISGDKKGGNQLSQAAYEATRCERKSDGQEKLTKFKTTMNHAKPDTSGTFSTSSLLYYHFSRYLNTSVVIPVAVYRSIDKDEHFKRVSDTKRAINTTAMNGGGWSVMRSAEENPSYYVPMDDLFTPDRKQIYGVFVGGGGARYGAEVNGIRSSWGLPQNMDFQQTPGFLALKSEQPLSTAIVEGETKARQNTKMNAAVGPEKINPLQMINWMKELTEITLLDYIFSQQDRIGNINYKWSWFYVSGSEVKSKDIDSEAPRNKISTLSPPDELKNLNPVLVQKSYLDDNDAGGLPRYANFTKSAKMLEGIRHYNRSNYTKLTQLNKDFQTKGDLYKYVSTNFGLTPDELRMIVNNTSLATGILQMACSTGHLQFDLDPEKFMLGQAQSETVDCVNP